MSTVAVVGASPDTERYSNKALKLLREKGHTAIPVAPIHDLIEGTPVHRSVREISDDVDTVTMYLGQGRQGPVIEDVLSIAPRRVIFNPGAENASAYERLRKSGIEVVEACTLVLLSTGQF